MRERLLEESLVSLFFQKQLHTGAYSLCKVNANINRFKLALLYVTRGRREKVDTAEYRNILLVILCLCTKYQYFIKQI